MKFRKKIIASLLISGGVLGVAGQASANDSDELEKLRALVQELDQKIRVLDRKSELAAEDAAVEKKKTPIVKAGEDGFGLQSADGKFKLKLGALFQGDARYIQTDTPGAKSSDYLLRRAELDFQATVYDKYDFRLLSESNSQSTGVLDAYLNARFLPEFKVQFGKFKAPVSLERLQAGGALKFIDRTYIADSLMPNRDIGLQVHGDLFKGKLSYAGGVFDGQVDGQQANNGPNEDDNSDKDFDGRLFLQPFKGDDSALAGLGFGIAGTFGNVDGSWDSTNLTKGYKTPGRLTFFQYRKSASATNTVVADGDRKRWTPQAYYTYGPFYLLGEYGNSSHEVARINGTTTTRKTLDHDAWQIATSWILTGENNSFGMIKPKRPFDLDTGGWGAWEAALRYSELNIDPDSFKGGANSFADPTVSASSAKSWAAGLNWHLNNIIKIASTYEQTRFDGGAGTAKAISDRDTEDVFTVRFQAAF